MHPITTVTASLFAALSLGDEAALAPAIETAPRFPAPEVVLHDVDPEGRLWALGRTYKASAGAEGFTYVPYLGAHAPQSFPVAFRLASVEVDGEPARLAANAIPSRDGDTWTLDRGPVDVVYELSLDSVEQVVVVGDVSSGGDVRASFAVDSTLARSTHAGGFRYSGEYGEVLYGAAIALAPDGRSCAVRAEPTVAGFDLIVPSEFVATVEGPLVIDPVISSGAVANVSNRPAVSVDMASDPDIGFVAAIEREFSATDHDVFLYRIPEAGLSTSGTLVSVVDFTTDTWTEPSVAGRNTNNDFLTVATRGAGASRRVWGRVASGPAWSAGSQFAIYSQGESYAPDVGSDHVPSILTSSRWMVVFETDSNAGLNVRGQLMGPSGAIGGPFIVGFSSLDKTQPRISETAGPPGSIASQRFTIAYLRESQTFGDEIMVEQRGHDGSVVTNPFIAVPSTRVVNVDVAGPANEVAPNGEGIYLLVHESRALFSNNRSITATVCAGGTAFESTNITTMTDVDRDDIQLTPVAGCDGNQFLVAYEERDLPNTTGNVYFCSGNAANGRFGLAERRGELGVTGANEFGPSIATMWEGGDPAADQRGFVAWTSITSIVRQVAGGHVVSRNDADRVCGHQYCEANVNSSGMPAWICALGDSGTTGSKRIQVHDAPPNATCYILVARGENFVPLVAGSHGNLCLGGTNFGRFSNAAALTTSAGFYELTFSPQSIAQPNGAIAALSGETWYFQGWFRDFITAPVSNLSNGVAIPFE